MTNHSDADRGEIPKLKSRKEPFLAEKSPFAVKTIVALISNDPKFPGWKTYGGIILCTETNRLTHVSDSGCRGLSWRFYFKNSKTTIYSGSRSIQIIFVNYRVSFYLLRTLPVHFNIQKAADIS